MCAGNVLKQTQGGSGSTQTLSEGAERFKALHSLDHRRLSYFGNA